MINSLYKIELQFLIFITGLCFGSFLNCMSYRYVNNISFFKRRSFCDSCKNSLKPLDLIPVISFVLNGGRCRFCKTKISLRYPLTELAGGFGYLIIFLKFGLTFKTAIYLILFSCLFVLSLIDLDVYEIPDITIAISFLSWIILNIFEHNFIKGLFSGIITALFLLTLSFLMKLFLNKEVLGGGDIKLLFITGLYLDITLNFINLFLSCLFGLLYSLITEKEIIPFGPAISFSFMILLLYGDKALMLYRIILDLLI